jgi:hypothetical protein
MEGGPPQRCALQSLFLKEKAKKTIAAPPPLPSAPVPTPPATAATHLKKIPKRALKEITNINSTNESQKKPKKVIKESEEEQSASDIREFLVLLSNSLLRALGEAYEQNKNEASIITEVTVRVSSLLFARQAFGSLGNVKFSSEFLERRALTSREDFMSWLTSDESHRSTLEKIQFEKGDIIMSSTELTMRIWYTRLRVRARSTEDREKVSRLLLVERRYPQRPSSRS